MLAVFCCRLPAVACAGPSACQARLYRQAHCVSRSGPGGRARFRGPGCAWPRPGGGHGSALVEELPASFRDVTRLSATRTPWCRAACSAATTTGSAHPSRRLHDWPVRGQFADPFDVTILHRGLDDGDRLTVAPAAVELPARSRSRMAGGRTAPAALPSSPTPAMTTP